MLRKVLLLSLVLLAGLYVAADFGARALADTGVSKELQASLHLSKRPAVSLGSFPFLPKLVSGHTNEVSVAGRGFRADGVAFDRVSLELKDVTFSAFRVLRGTATSIGIGSGSGTATLAGTGLSDALRAAGVAATVRLEGARAIVRVSGAGDVTVRVRLRHDALILRSDALPSSIRVTLPEVVPGVRYRRAVIRDGRAVLSFSIPKSELRIPG